MKRAIVVGSGGQDGSILYDQLSGESAVVGLERHSLRTTASIDCSRADILDNDEVGALIRSFLPDQVYYLAAFHHSSDQQTDSELELFEKSFAVNVSGLLNFLEAIRTHSRDTRLFYCGSSHVFGRATTNPQDEATHFSPECVYGIAKATGIQCCRYYRNTHSLFASTGILYNHESPFRRPHFVSQKIIRGAWNIKRGKQSTLFLGDLSAEIDWGYAPDYVLAMRQILEQEQPDDFVVATGISHSVRDFVKTAFGYLGLDWTRYVKEDPGLILKPRRSLVGNSSKLRLKTGWKPSVSFEEMIAILLKAEEQRTS